MWCFDRWYNSKQLAEEVAYGYRVTYEFVHLVEGESGNFAIIYWSEDPYIGWHAEND